MPAKMSTSSQNNGKKSSNSSIVNTPSSTPVTNIANGSTQLSSPPPSINAPKYGTLVPNRIFVGGISANTTEGELMQLFSHYGTVKAAKIIQDRAGVSKGYGFITFESEDDAKRPLSPGENIVLRERKLNVAPAVKKQSFNRAYDASSPPTVAAGNPAQFFFPPGGTVPYYQGGVAYYHQPSPGAPGDPTAQQPVYQPPPMYPTQTGPPQTAAYPSMMFPQTIYMPQQYPMPMPYDYNFYQGNGAAPSTQYMAGGQSGPGGPQCTPMPPSNSPPRPNCYGQQMPTYNPGDPMFYNLPLYGATMEGPPIYTEAFELGAGGPFAEESYNSLDQTVTQDVETSHLPPQAVTSAATHTVITSDNNNTTRRTSVPRSATVDASIGSGGNKPPPSYHHQEHAREVSAKVSRAPPPRDERNSHTPVVSLLSIDHQQEKDYSSMQSGRRRKPLAQTTQNNLPVYPVNGYVNPFVGFNPQQPPPPPPPFGPPVYNNGYGGYTDYRRFNGFANVRPMNDNGNYKARRRAYEYNNVRRSNDHSSRSSLRTDSNSSASCVDENKNDERAVRTSVNTPPPAPYSPMTHQQFKIITNSNVKNFYNKQHNNNNNSSSSNSYCYRPTATPPNDDTSPTKNKNGSSNPFINNNNNNDDVIITTGGSSNSSSSTNLDPESLHSSNSQVHLSTSQSFVPATAQAQARRNKRSLRRSGAGGGGLNEIGGGDAPPPDEVTAEVCKKLETLKL